MLVIKNQGGNLIFNPKQIYVDFDRTKDCDSGKWNYTYYAMADVGLVEGEPLGEYPSAAAATAEINNIFEFLKNNSKTELLTYVMKKGGK